MSLDAGCLRPAILQACGRQILDLQGQGLAAIDPPATASAAGDLQQLRQ